MPFTVELLDLGLRIALAIKLFKDEIILKETLMLFQKVPQDGLDYSEASGLLSVLTQYTHSFVLLNQYDTGNFPKNGLNEHVIDVINHNQAIKAIGSLREKLIAQKEATALFYCEKPSFYRWK